MPAVFSIGDRFGKLVIVGPAEKCDGKTKWPCRCDCGNTSMVIHGNLKNGGSRTCGCSRRTHGYAGNNIHPTYISWSGMKSRCYRVNDREYPRYGGRGIAVCERWKNSFLNFLADMGHRPQGTTLDRKNNNLGYAPGNCRWATVKEQCRNKRNNVRLTWNGKTQCASEWAEELKIPVLVLLARLKKGWSVDRALSTPVRPKRKSIRHD